MLELTIKEGDGNHSLLKDKLENLSIANKVYESEDVIEPTLKEGEKSYTGYKQIFEFLEEQEIFVKQWYECRCGNHGDEIE